MRGNHYVPIEHGGREYLPFRSQPEEETVPFQASNDAASPAQGLILCAVGDGIVATFGLPAAGVRVIGRSREADLHLDDPSISRRHAILRMNEGRVTIEDAGSANGTRVNGRATIAGEAVVLAPGEPIELGAVMLVLQPARIGSRARTSSIHHPLAAGGDAFDVHVEPVLVGHEPMEQLHRMVERIARGQISVLLLGETGVGKEVMAETIHRQSSRSSGPFLRLNCAALSESLLESELFGHEAGAFTGAMRMKPGLLETAGGGTVFLDEVGELPAPLQVKLLRVLEERRVRRVGGLDARPIDVRFVAATNRDLEAEIEAGRFREDLYYRLNGISLWIPPLRERRAEIRPLAETFILRCATESGLERVPALSEAARELLESYAWPGNVRELRNFMDRAVLLSAGEPIEPRHLPVEKMRAESASPAEASLRGELDALERRRILDALEACHGNQTDAAKRLGIARGTLLARLEKFGLPRPKKRARSISVRPSSLLEQPAHQKSVGAHGHDACESVSS